MSYEILKWILVEMALVLPLVITLIVENRRMGRELTELHKAVLKNQMVRETLDASVKTGSMLGPATLQQMREPPKVEAPKEPEKKSGVSISY